MKHDNLVSENPIDILARDFRRRYGSYGIEIAIEDIKMRYYLFGLFALYMPHSVPHDFNTMEKIFTAAQDLINRELD